MATTTNIKQTSNRDKVNTYLRARIELKYNTISEYARRCGRSVQYISNILCGRRSIPEFMLKEFKIGYVTTKTEKWEVDISQLPGKQKVAG